MLKDAVLAKMSPVVVSDLPTLTRYADALVHYAAYSEATGRPVMAQRLFDRALYLLSLAR